MTASSEHGAFLRFDPTLLGALKPLDTGMVRDVLVNNARHGYDQSFQLRAHWISDDTTAQFLTATNTTSLPELITSIVFPYTIRANGTGAPIVCRLFAKRTSNAFTPVIHVGLVPFTAPLRPPLETASWTTTLTPAATTYAWVDTASPTIAMDSAAIADAVLAYGTPVSLGGSRTTASTYFARLDIYAKNASTSTLQVAGWRVREYVGS